MSVRLAQKILLDKFRQEPFHNLYLLNNIKSVVTKYGGTCSDKTLSYLSAVRAAGLDAYLHSARIGGQEIHRLVRLEIDNERYFADIGNGWPSLQLFPASKPVNYECYGMRYRTEIKDQVMKVFHTKHGLEKQQMELDLEEKFESVILQDISQRFNRNIVYPFQKYLRFSMVVDDKFLFIRDRCLEVYKSEQNYSEILVDENLEMFIQQHFKYDIRVIMEAANLKHT